MRHIYRRSDSFCGLEAGVVDGGRKLNRERKFSQRACHCIRGRGSVLFEQLIKVDLNKKMTSILRYLPPYKGRILGCSLSTWVVVKTSASINDYFGHFPISAHFTYGRIDES